MLKDKEHLIQCRIDFGCCVDGDKDKYFINGKWVEMDNEQC